MTDRFTHLSDATLQHLQARLRLQEVLLCNYRCKTFKYNFIEMSFKLNCISK